MKKFEPAGWLFPKPVMIIGTYDKDGKPNAMNADCGGSWDRTEISLFLGKIRQTTLNLQACNEFTLALANKDTVAGADYVGITSGLREPNKIAKTGWSIEKAPDVNAPLFTDFPLTLECRIKEILDATSADCYHIIAEIVNILVDEKYLGSDGYPDIQRMKLICHETVHQTYIQLGEKAGKAFHDGVKLR
jgi:flavin reductase (DIM6/NTAB) family NADH-FMN oxidoreductase RutF